jgi:hypothetical protein
MAAKIFSITNTRTGAVERLVKADTRGQVNKHLQKMYAVEIMGAVEIADLAMKGQLVVDDATAEAAEPGEGESDDAAAAAAAAAAPAAASASESVEVRGFEHQAA